MTREKAIEDVMKIVQAVFLAEDAVSKKWEEKLRWASQHGTKEDRAQITDDYVRDIALEMLKHTSDEELSKIEEDEKIIG